MYKPTYKERIYAQETELLNADLVREVRHYNTSKQCQSIVVLFNPHKKGSFNIFIYSYLSDTPLLVATLHSIKGVISYLFKSPFKQLPFFTVNVTYVPEN